MSCIFPCSNWCENLPTVKSNALAAIIGGILFFTGWWLLFDAHAVHSDVIKSNGEYYVPGLFGTASMILVNIIPIRLLEISQYYGQSHECSPLQANIALFIGLTTAFGSLIGSTYILINHFLNGSKHGVWQPHWPPCAVFLQNVMIFSANMILKFGTRDEKL